MQYNFEWDPVKATINANKHGVTFEQAIDVFKDPMALTLYEDEESTPDEDRWVTVGLVNHQYYLLVVHTCYFPNSNRTNSPISTFLLSYRCPSIMTVIR
jgi:hypothetical protein